MSRYFSARTWRFLRALARNNSREWFNTHRGDYETHLREPFLRLIGDLQTPLAAISNQYVANPRRSGGSLFRIHRDTRFSHDKTPYKTWSGARCYHLRSREIQAPTFYIHIEPGNSFVGGGRWHPEPPTLRRIREFIADNPEAWLRATRRPGFQRDYRWGGESLVRPPRGYPVDHPLIEDLKRRDFVASKTLPDGVVTGSGLLEAVVDGFQGAAPLVDYLCAAVDLEF